MGRPAGDLLHRSRPYKKSDQATVESKNNHLMRRYSFYRLWPLVSDRLNYLTPPKKQIGYASSRDSRRRRLYLATISSVLPGTHNGTRTQIC